MMMMQNQDIQDVEVIGEEKVSPQSDQPTMLFSDADKMRMLNIVRARQEAVGKSKRKKGCKSHKSNPAGSKLARKLARQGNLYGVV